jgi:hypothetical protein
MEKKNTAGFSYKNTALYLFFAHSVEQQYCKTSLVGSKRLNKIFQFASNVIKFIE